MIWSVHKFILAFCVRFISVILIVHFCNSTKQPLTKNTSPPWEADLEKNDIDMLNGKFLCVDL